MNFEEFKRQYRDKEAAVGPKMEAVGEHIVARQPVTDEELLEMYQSLKSESLTGVEHHGDIIGGGNVLDLYHPYKP